MIAGILFTIFLVLLNGFFVAAEFSMVKVRASQLEIKAKAGSKLAPAAQSIISNLDAYLAATQLGITLASLGLGWIGESVVAKLILKFLEFSGIEMSATMVHSISLPIAFITITFLHIVFGELAPKSLAIKKAEDVILSVSLPLKAFYFAFRPFIWALNGIANLFLKLMGLPMVQGEGTHSAEEIVILLEQGKNSGAIETTEHELIKNVFQFNDRIVKQIMVPRTQIVAIDVSLSNDEILDKVIKEGYSRLPVYENDLDNIIGIIFAKDLLAMVTQKENFVIQKTLHRPYFIPETKQISDLLHEFQGQHTHIAVVVDEFGGIVGLVTLEDIIEELVGEIQDEYDEEKPMVEKIGDDEFIVNAHSALTDVNEYLPSPIPEGEDYDTVAGYLNVLFRKIPEVNETHAADGYEFTILKKSHRTVQLVKLVKTKLPDDTDE